MRLGLGLGISRNDGGPAMSLNFLSPFLDPRITFSRGSNATLVDATGKITYAPANLLTYSEDFTNAAWVTSFATVTADSAVAPDGTTTADLLTSSGDGRTRQGVACAGSTTYIGSVWLRVTSGTASINLYRTDNSTGFDTTAAAVTTTWQRFSIKGTTAAAATVANLQIGGNSSFSSGSTLLIWGAQLEPVTYQTTPSTYVATTTSAYYGPRFDYDPVTLAPKGLLIEEQRVNLLTYSDQFDNAAWSKINCTVTTNATTSPDGTTNAEKLIVTNALSTGNVSQIPTLAASTAYTETVFAKKGEWNWVALETRGEVGDPLLAWFNLNTGVVGTVNVGATATITNFGNGWYRCSLTRTTGATTTSPRARVYATNADAVLSTGDGTSGIFIYGAQLEAGSFATSYIPTVASTVTRSADVATMTGTNFSSWYNQSEGTVVTNFDTAIGSAALGVVFGGGSNVLQTRVEGGRARSGIRAVVDLITGTGPTVSMPGSSSVASAYKSGDNAIAANGGTAVTSSVTFTATGGALVGLGFDSLTNTNWINGHIRAIAYYNTRLPNVQLVSLTT